MQHVFINGQVAILVHYCEERTKPDLGDGDTEWHEVDGGARIDVRRVEEYHGANTREGTAGFRILPVDEGGIWRIDLSTRIDSDVPEPRYHHHPTFANGDVGPRVFDKELTDDALGWIERQFRNLPAALVERGHPALAATVDTASLDRALPSIMAAVEACSTAPRVG